MVLEQLLVVDGFFRQVPWFFIIFILYNHQSSERRWMKLKTKKHTTMIETRWVLMCFDERLFSLVQFFKCVEVTWILCMLRTNWLEWNPSFVCACAHCLNMVRLSKPVPCAHDDPSQRALKCSATFILLGSTERRSGCCWSENFSIQCEAPRICVWKAVFPPYVGSVVHPLTSHGLSDQAVPFYVTSARKRKEDLWLELIV